MRKVTKAAFARWCGISAEAVTLQTRQGKALHEALVKNKINVEHHAARDFLATHGVHELPPNDDFEQGRKHHRANTDRTPKAWDLSQLENYTVKEIVMRFGSVQGFKAWIDALRSISEYQRRELQVQEQRGDMIPRAVVEQHVMPILEVCFLRLVTDVPDTLSRQVVARVESGGPETVAEVQRMFHDQCEKVITHAIKQLKELPFLFN